MSDKIKFTDVDKAFISKAEQYCATAEQCRTSVMEKLLTWARRANRHCLSRVKSQTRLTATGDNMSVHSDQL